MIAGIDFPSSFTKDNFKSRRTTGHNLHDPESLITGADIAAGFTYTNSARDWGSQQEYTIAVLGHLTCEQIVCRAPRVLLTKPAHINSLTTDVYQETT
jgi:hypothetical protein